MTLGVYVESAVLGGIAEVDYIKKIGVADGSRNNNLVFKGKGSVVYDFEGRQVIGAARLPKDGLVLTAFRFDEIKSVDVHVVRVHNIHVNLPD